MRSQVTRAWRADNSRRLRENVQALPVEGLRSRKQILIREDVLSSQMFMVKAPVTAQEEANMGWKKGGEEEGKKKEGTVAAERMAALLFLLDYELQQQ